MKQKIKCFGNFLAIYITKFPLMWQKSQCGIAHCDFSSCPVCPNTILQQFDNMCCNEHSCHTG